MKIESKFNVEDMVHILPLDVVGTIEEIGIDRKGLKYYVKYYYYMEAKYGYFTDKELKLQSKQSNCGYLLNTPTESQTEQEEVKEPKIYNEGKPISRLEYQEMLVNNELEEDTFYVVGGNYKED